MPTQEYVQSCSRKYRDTANFLHGLASLVGWIGIIIALVLFALSLFGETRFWFAIILAAFSALLILLGKLVKHQCDVINAILEIVNEPSREQD